ncbi:MAG: phosphatidate cytidylyltransferase [Holosporales bacterium]|jgi:phosphatidate cytidylyltransferase
MTRLASGVLLILATLTGLWLGSTYFSFLAGICAVLLTYEAINLYPRRGWNGRTLLLCAIPLLAYGAAVFLYSAVGPWAVLSGLAIIWATDVGAFFVGRHLGKTPLAPVLSPKKTYEGLAGGMAAAVLVSALVRYPQVNDFSSNDALAAIGIGLGLAVLATLGDIAESAYKRQCGVKDSSSLIPGHGGFLDRLDSTLLPLPLIALGILFLREVGS